MLSHTLGPWWCTIYRVCKSYIRLHRVLLRSEVPSEGSESVPAARVPPTAGLPLRPELLPGHGRFPGEGNQHHIARWLLPARQVVGRDSPPVCLSVCPSLCPPLCLSVCLCVWRMECRHSYIRLRSTKWCIFFVIKWCEKVTNNCFPVCYFKNKIILSLSTVQLFMQNPRHNENIYQYGHWYGPT